MAKTRDLPTDRSNIRCDTQELILNNGDGISFSTGEIINIENSNLYDIYFKDDKFYAQRNRGEIATVGDKGSKTLCHINYPVSGFVDMIKIINNNVYMYKSKNGTYRTEIRVKSYNESEDIKIIFHVRTY